MKSFLSTLVCAAALAVGAQALLYVGAASGRGLLRCN